jgi:hypothetical protein
VRVRTYGFPGCFTRPPGTSTRHHPHEPTMSKPVVPVDAAHSLAAPPRLRGPPCAGPERSDAVPSRFEEPSPVSGPRAFLRFWVARPHTSVASLFAARFRVWIQPNQGLWPLQVASSDDAAFSVKSVLRRPSELDEVPSRARPSRRLEREAMERRDVPAGPPASVAAERKRRGPGPLEEPFPASGPRAFFRFRWRGLTPRWPRSLRLGSASGSNLARAARRRKGRAAMKPHPPRKSIAGASERHAGVLHRALRLLGSA